MTYFGFLLRFLILPILILSALHWRDMRKGVSLPQALNAFSPWRALLALILIAVTYTTPWDNYLVATRVWWYEPALVTGITIGYVPIEEYTFFVLQTVLTGLWVLWLARRIPHPSAWRTAPLWRLLPLGVLGALWILSVAWLILNVREATYMALILVWALPPIMLQVWFGGDILRAHIRLVALGIFLPTFFLCAADALAIAIGIWEISPEQTFGIHLWGGLPLEEATFFLLTNVLITFGLVLAIADASQVRLRAIARRARLLQQS
ncbi:MAG: lycopene cyclase domain-containing protein [Ardenticatenia bacterium]|nr:MAG: lycopene cyclase domain-containing protein [Ardenticatenia bacterium]